MNKAVLFLLITLPFGAIAQDNKVATIERSQGFTAVQRGGDWHLAGLGQELYEGDKLYAGDGARLEFDFVDGTSTTLGEFSNFSIDIFDWADQQPNPSASFTLYSGVFRTITGKITQTASPRFFVDTPLASIGIRGTDFWGGYLDEGKVDVFFVEGEHSIEISTNNGSAVLEEPGQGVTLSEDGSISDVVTWGAPKIERAVNTVTFD